MHPVSGDKNFDRRDRPDEECKRSGLPGAGLTQAEFEGGLREFIAIEGKVVNGRQRLEYHPSKVTVRFETHLRKDTAEESRLFDKAQGRGLTFSLETVYPASYISLTGHFYSAEGRSATYRALISFMNEEQAFLGF